MADRAMPPASPHGEHFAEVVLVRHGETDWNVSRVIQGQMDQELNETGRLQAAMVARRLSEETKPAAVYSSGLTRAAETAQLIAGACGVPDSDVSTLTQEQINLNFTISICYFFFSLRGSVRVLYVVRMNGFYSFQLVIDQTLTERHMGLFQGWSIVDAIKSEEYYMAFARGGRDQEIPGGGESLHQLSERCVPCLNAIAERHKGGRVVVVTHGAVIEEICWHADPTSPPVRRKFPNTSISIVHISGSGDRWVLEKFGDVGHLTTPHR